MNKTNYTRGVIYFNMGTSCIPRMLTSIHSLRKHYQGPVTIISTGKDSDEFFKLHTQPKETTGYFGNVVGASNTFANLRVDIKYQNFDDVPHGHSHVFLLTTLADTYTPYDLTVWLDADTIVRGSIDELFDAAAEHDMVVPNFANWHSNGGTIMRRIEHWRQYYPEFIEKAINFGPAINCGVIAWKHGCDFMRDWYSKTLPGRDGFIPNETCMQVILPQYKHIIVDQKFNCSCKYSDCYATDVRVVHYHGRKHCRIRDGKLQNHAELWVKEFNEVLTMDYLHIKDWQPGGDRHLAKYYARLNEEPVAKVAKKDKKAKKIEKNDKPATVYPKKVRKMEKIADKRLTIVTAVTPNYLEKLATTFPTWSIKPQFRGSEVIIFHHGFTDTSRITDITKSWAGNVRLVEWNMEKYDSIRELMLSAFVMGAAVEVETPYCVKIDCDTFFLDDKDVFFESHFCYDVVGHTWHYSKPGKWLVQLDDWADKMKLPGNRYIADEKTKAEALTAKRFGHPRFSSWICLQKTDFLLEVAKLIDADGGRMPVASHDTLLHYLAQRLPHRAWAWHKLKKNGAATHTDLNVIKERVSKEIKVANV